MINSNMYRLNKSLNYLILLLMLVALSACGGGGGNSNTGNSNSNNVLFGTSKKDVSRRIIVDEARQRILITGFTTGNLDGKINSGGRDIFVSEYDLNLKLKWTTLLGTAGDDAARALAVSSTGEIYIAGSTAGNLGGKNNQGLSDIFLAKLDKSGNTQWIELLGTSSDDEARGLAIDSNNNIYIAGGSGGSLGGLSYAGGVQDMFIARFDSNGNRIWLRLVGGVYSDVIRDVTIDNNDNILVCGWYSDGGAQIYLAKYDTAGSIIWSQLLGEIGNDFCHKVVTDSSGNVYLSGDSATDLGGNINQGDRDIVIAKYDSAGNKLWVKLLGTSVEERGFAIGLTSNNTIYVTGTTLGNLNGVSNNGMDDIFVSSFDNNGNLQSVNLYGTGVIDRANDIYITSGDAMYITGRTDGNLDGDINAGSSDIFIKKLK